MVKTKVATPDPDRPKRTIDALKKLIAQADSPNGGRER